MLKNSNKNIILREKRNPAFVLSKARLSLILLHYKAIHFALTFSGIQTGERQPSL
jgi:hypothetical protein